MGEAEQQLAEAARLLQEYRDRELVDVETDDAAVAFIEKHGTEELTDD